MACISLCYSNCIEYFNPTMKCQYSAIFIEVNYYCYLFVMYTKLLFPAVSRPMEHFSAWCSQLHCSRHLRDQSFKEIYLEIYWKKSFQIVVLFSRIIVLGNAVVTEKKISKILFFTSPPHYPKNTSVSEPLRS